MTLSRTSLSRGILNCLWYQGIFPPVPLQFRNWYSIVLNLDNTLGSLREFKKYWGEIFMGPLKSFTEFETVHAQSDTLRDLASNSYWRTVSSTEILVVSVLTDVGILTNHIRVTLLNTLDIQLRLQKGCVLLSLEKSELPSRKKVTTLFRGSEHSPDSQCGSHNVQQRN